MTVVRFPHDQRRRAIAAAELSYLTRQMAIECLSQIYRACGRAAFLDACADLADAVDGIREHEEAKERAGLPLGPGTGQA
jgi:hypothetical protein